MAAVNIPSSDKVNIKDFDGGNSIQVRITIPDSEKGEYVKGKTVRVVYGNNEAAGKIVSDPIVIDEEKIPGKEILSLIVEKST